MKTTIKILTAKQEVAQYAVSHGETLILASVENANYQLIDEQTGVAPQNIIAKREGNHLVITLEDGDMQPDILIEGYYSDNGRSDSAIIGQHENGKLYAYVPESGETEEAISILADEMAAPQALGGDELDGAFWVFNPWWLGAMPLVGALFTLKPKLKIIGGGEIDTTPVPDPAPKQVDLSGVSQRVNSGETVQITLTDQHGVSVSVQAKVDGNGRYFALDTDTAALFDGPVTVYSEALDHNGHKVTDLDHILLDQRIPGDSDSDAVTDEVGKPQVRLQDGGDARIHSPDLSTNGTALARITFPADSGYTVGDTLIVTDRNATVLLERTLTDADLANGLVVAFTPNPIEGGLNAISAVVIDPQSNRSNTGSATAMTDLRIPGDNNLSARAESSDFNQGAPKITLKTAQAHAENLNSPDLINEKAVALIEVPASRGYSVGDRLQVFVNNQSLDPITLTADHLANGVEIPFTPAAEGQTNSVTAQVTDPQGNQSQIGTAQALSDLIMPGDENRSASVDERDFNKGEPKITIKTAQAHADNLNSPDLVNEKSVAVIEVPASRGYSVGDHLQISVNNQPLDPITLTADHLANGVEIPFTPAAEGQSNNVTAQVTDPQGNQSRVGTAQAISDLIMPGDENRSASVDERDFNKGAPKITIKTAQAHAENLNSPDLVNEKAVALIEVPENRGYSVGDRLQVFVNNQPLDPITLTADHLAKGVEIPFTPAAEGQANTVTAQVTDPQGNQSQIGTAQAISDLIMPGDENRSAIADERDFNKGAPKITIKTAQAHAENLNSPDLENGNAVALIEVPESRGYSVGDRLQVSVNNQPLDEIVLTADHLANGVEIPFTPAAEGQANTVTAQVTDPQGNQSQIGTAQALSDLIMPGDENRSASVDERDFNKGAPKITIKTAQAHAENLNSPDLENGNAVALIEVPASRGYSVGDRLQISVNNQPLDPITLTADHLAKGVEIPFTPAAEGQSNNVTAQVTDPQGNQSQIGTAQALSDLIMPGDENRSADLNASDFNKGAPKITIKTAQADAENLNSPDLINEKAVALIEVPESRGYSVGDRLQVSVNNQPLDEIVLTAEHLANGVEIPFTPAAEGQSNNVTAQVTDPQGNQSQVGTAQAISDLIMPGDENRSATADERDFNKGEPKITIKTAQAHAENLNSPDLVNEKAVALIEVPASRGYSVGDRLQVSVNNQPLDEIVLTADHLANGVEIPFTPAAEGQSNNVTAQVTDPQGNQSQVGTAQAISDLIMPGDENRSASVDERDFNKGAPKITIKTAQAHAENLNSPDLVNEKAVALIEVPASRGYSVGDRLQVSVNNQPLDPITLTADHLANGVEIPFTPAAEGQANRVTAQVTDPQGNQSQVGIDQALSDLIMPGDENRSATANERDFNKGAPKITIKTTQAHAENLNSSDLINEKAVALIEVPESRGYSVGDRLQVSVNNQPLDPITLTADHLANGVEISFTPAAEGQANTVTAQVTDPQGNQSQVGTAQALSDLIMPGDENRSASVDERDFNKGAPKITIKTAQAHAENLNSPDLVNEKAVALIEVPASRGYSIGDRLQVSVNNQPLDEIVLTADHLAKGVEISFTPVAEGQANTVTAQVTDPQGNQSQIGTAQAISDLIMPGDENRSATVDERDFNKGAPKIMIKTAQAHADNLNSPDLVNEKAVAVIEVPASRGYSVGDRLQVSVNNQPFDPITLTADHLANGVEIPFTPAAEGHSNSVTAQVTDPQGNQSQVGTAQALSDLIMPGDENRSATVDERDFNKGAPKITIKTAQAHAENLNSPDLINEKAVALIEVPASRGYSVGDRLQVSINNQPLDEIVLTAEHLAKGVEIPFTPAAEGQSNSVTAQVTDPQGNQSQIGTDQALSDLIMPGDENRSADLTANDFNQGAPVVTIGAGNNNALIEVPAARGYSVGDTLEINAPNKQQTVTLTAEHLQNGVRVEFTPLADGQANRVTAQVTDPQGNRSQLGSDTAVNRGTPQVTIKVGTTPAINSPDLENNLAVATIRFPSDRGFKAGDTLSVTLPKNQSKSVVLTEADLTNGVKVPFEPAAEGQANIVTAVVTDPKGNRSPIGQAQAISDLIMPGDENRSATADERDFNKGAPKITIKTAQAHAENLNSPDLENGNAVALIEVPASRGYSVGDRLQISVNNQPLDPITLTADHLVKGVEIPFTPAAEGQSNNVTAQVTDPQGNRSAVGTAQAMSDLRIPGDSNRSGSAEATDVNGGKPQVEIQTGSDNDIHIADLTNGKASVTIRVPENQGYSAGDRLEINLPNQTTPEVVILTARHLQNGYTTTFTPNGDKQNNLVTASVIDPQGNRSLEGNDAALTVLPPPDPSTTTTLNMLVPMNIISLRNIQVSFAGVQEQSIERARSVTDNGNLIEWGRSSAERSHIQVTPALNGNVESRDLNTFFQVMNLHHQNRSLDPSDSVLKQTGLNLRFDLTINGKQTSVSQRSFGDVYIFETNGGVYREGDFFVFKTLPQTIAIDGAKYMITLENSAANAANNNANRNLVDQLVPAHSEDSDSRISRLVPSGLSRLTQAEKNSALYIQSAENVSSDFSLGFKVTSTDPNAAKPASLPAEYSGKVNDQSAAWQSVGGGLTVTQTTSGTFELKKGNLLLGRFVGKTNGEYSFTPLNDLKNINHDELLTAAFKKGKHTVELNLKGIYSTDAAKLAADTHQDVLYKIAGTDTLDYTAVPNSIEVIDLRSGDNIRLQNVTLANLKAHRHNGLYIQGDSRDSIELGNVLESGAASQRDSSGVWSKGAAHSATKGSGSALTYDTWSHTDGTLLYIQQGIQVV